ncbi:hypothetical protein VP01_2955g2 [Puccinia sorghi]|uniref:Uncharacterized protein n=1 Tax=Puccinia sorghi TaxID=27349 RepID=A0A0L6V2P2_9BASI|nr:hypothetical protein VP01_2955g2 [Puccinia sorghi]
MMWRSVAWARRVLNKNNPCRYCWEWVHWVGDCHFIQVNETCFNESYCCVYRSVFCEASCGNRTSDCLRISFSNGSMEGCRVVFITRWYDEE